MQDLPILARIEQEAFGDGAYTEMTFRQFLDIAGPLLRVAVDADMVVGYVLALPTIRREVCLMSVAVAPEWRKQGLARELMSDIVGAGEVLGYTSIWLTTKPTNTPMIRLCEAFGFTLEYEESNYFGHGEDRLVMVRESPAHRAFWHSAITWKRDVMKVLRQLSSSLRRVRRDDELGRLDPGRDLVVRRGGPLPERPAKS